MTVLHLWPAHGCFLVGLFIRVEFDRWPKEHVDLTVSLLRKCQQTMPLGPTPTDPGLREEHFKFAKVMFRSWVTWL